MLYRKFIAVVIGLVLLFGGCGRQQGVLTHAEFHPDSIGPFVEPEFPFITGPLNSNQLGARFPSTNTSARTLSIQLGDSAYVGFDMDLLRWSVAWQGDFLPMVTMSQVSYSDFFNKEDKQPVILGEPKIATGEYPGWSVDIPSFVDPRNPAKGDGPKRYGPLPAQLGRWNGVYLHGDKVGLSYTIGRTDILELPGSMRFGDEVAFLRTVEFDGLQETLHLHVAEVHDATETETVGPVMYTYHGANRDTVTAVAVVTNDWPAIFPTFADSTHITISFPTSPAPRPQATVVIWHGPASLRSSFEQLPELASVRFPDFRKGGPAYWKETVYTRGEVSPDTAAYVTDRLTLPIPNPWRRNVRVADIAFFNGKRAAVATFDGDVWIVDGINDRLNKLKWTRYASGLYEPMSIDIVDGDIYVFGKEGIVMLHDLNDDGVADYYENFSNGMEQSLHSREWAGDMVRAPDGSFFVAKGGIGGSAQRGSVMRISPDGRNVQTYATGLRGPYLGIHPERGILSASDQQGNYVPSTPIYLVNQGDYFGFPTSPTDRERVIKGPLAWIPHSVDRSAVSQTWVTGGKMGPLEGSMLHFSFARPGIFRVLIDSTGHDVQGGVSFIRAFYPAPTHKGTINPGDGQLYLTGFNLWGSSSECVAALLRLRYTGLPLYLPEDFKAGQQGIVLRFGVELDEETATNPFNFQVKRWNYKRTHQYGSGHFKLDGSPGEEVLQVYSSHISADRKAVFLVVPHMQEVMQMEIMYQLNAADGRAMDDGFWFTVKEANAIDLPSHGFLQPIDFDTPDPRHQQARNTDDRPSAERGAQLFQATACAGCHALDLGESALHGPPLRNLYLSERQFADGTSGVADDDYIRESILEPAKKVVKGYPGEMPSYLGVLSDGDVESLVMYIRSL